MKCWGGPLYTAAAVVVGCCCDCDCSDCCCAEDVVCCCCESCDCTEGTEVAVAGTYCCVAVLDEGVDEVVLLGGGRSVVVGVI